MEASTCGQVVSSHTSSLLMSLNLQRQQVQFCDCVVRQSQSPGQLYPAHRCVLAASSPVLASMLSSSGALVELQAPCLSGSVLSLLLDYIYTGMLPFTHTQQCYYSLLTTAHYLQMDELQEALRVWRQTEANDADKTTDSQVSGNENQKYKDSVQSTASSLEREDRRYSAKVEICDEDHMHSASMDSCIKGRETDICGANNINCASRCSSKDVKNVSTTCSLSEDCIDGANTVCGQVTCLTPQDLIQNILCSADMHGVSKVDKEVQKDHFHSSGIVKPGTWQQSTELVRAVEDKTSSNSSPHPCCGAVPVICHSSKAASHQLAEVSTIPPHHSESKGSVNSSRTPAPRSASSDNDSTVQGITTKLKNHYGVQNQDYRNDKYHTGTLSWDGLNSSDQNSTQDLCYESSSNQSHMLEQDYNSNTDYFINHSNEHMDYELSHITDHNNHHAQCDLDTNGTKYLSDDSAPQVKICRNFTQELKHKTEFSCDDLPSKQQHLDRCDGHSVAMSPGAEKLSQHQRAKVLLPAEESDTGNDCHCEDLCPKGKASEEHSLSCRCPAETDRQGFHCNVYEPKKDWSSKVHRAEPSTQDPDSEDRDTPMGDKRHSAVVSTAPESRLDNVMSSPFAFERHTSLEVEKTSEITESQITFPVPMDSNMSDSMYSVVGQSYHGHLHYHCIPQEDTQTLHRESEHKHSHPVHPDYLHQSSDEDEAVTFASTLQSSLRQQLASGTTDQVLLLDISAKPAALLVSYKQRLDKEETAIAFKNYTFGTGVRNNDREQENEVTSAAGADKKNNGAMAKLEAESFDEDDNKSWVGKTNEERKSVGKNHITQGADIHKPGASEKGSNPETVCLPPNVPDSVQASMSATLSVCINSNLSSSMPRNISAHLSTPLHPFQCSLCERSFSQRGSLNRHVRSHLGIRPFPCPCCPMTFSRQYRVTEHMRVHQRCTQGNGFNKPPASSV